MSVAIPFKDLPSFTESVTLDGVPLNFKFIWNGRDSAWFMDILDADNDAILNGVKIVNGWELIFRATDIRLPLGALLVVSLQGNEDVIRRDNMSTDYDLIYMTEAELDASL